MSSCGDDPTKRRLVIPPTNDRAPFAEAFLAIKNSSDSTASTVRLLRLLAPEFDNHSARLLERTARDLNGEAVDHCGRPPVDDHLPIQRILGAVARGYKQADAIAIEARALARHGGNMTSHAARLREKLRKSKAVGNP